MAGINQSTPAPVVQGQVYPSAPPLPAYYPGAGATSPAAASPPFYTQGTGGPYRQPSVVIVPGPSSGYSVEPGVKGNVGGPGPTVVYQPVATGMGQPAVVMYASSPELPVSPHPAIALGEHLNINEIIDSDCDSTDIAWNGLIHKKFIVYSVLGIIAIICCCNCVCGIPAIVLGAIVLAKHPREFVHYYNNRI